MDRRLMVKQFLGVLQGPFCRFNVLVSGQPGWVVLRPLDGDDCETSLEFAYPRKRFKRGVLPRGPR